MKGTDLYNCIINLDKPKGISSQGAVTKVKRLIGARKAGHAGTLDPLATGVLLVSCGAATRITRFLFDLDKEYVAVMKLGERTDTLDLEGKVVQRCEDFSFSREEIQRVARRFTGSICQKPPMYSAIKVGGKALYKLARKGMEIERPGRVVNVADIEVLAVNLPFVEIRVACSKGTYIRSLCDDMGRELGVGAHITELRRIRIGSFSIQDSISLEELDDLRLGSDETRHGGVLTIDEVLDHLGELFLSDREVNSFRNGVPLKKVEHVLRSCDNLLRMKDKSGNLIGIGKVSDDTIKIECIFNFGHQS